MKSREQRRREHGSWAHLPRDPREAIALVGNALATTHDTSGLLSVILDIMVEATEAAGGRVLDDDREVARVGESAGGSRTSSTSASRPEAVRSGSVLDPPRGRVYARRDRAREWLAAQAAIALENARLHHVVRRQALTDELTGLVNRRRFIEALDAEIARTQPSRRHAVRPRRRPRRLQADQRPLRPSGRRRGVADVRRPSSRPVARDRHCCAPRRRGVRDPPSGNRSRGCSHGG